MRKKQVCEELVETHFREETVDTEVWRWERGWHGWNTEEKWSMFHKERVVGSTGYVI